MGYKRMDKSVIRWLAAVLLCVAAFDVQADSTALDSYVAKPDDNFTYFQYHTDEGAGYTAYFLRMISQQWRTSDEVNRMLWEHELIVYVPWWSYASNPHTAIFIVNGGENRDPPSQEGNEYAGWLAAVTGSVTAIVSQIPNQPLYFMDEANRPRKEDEILAYGMDKYLRTGDPEWLPQLPMTKAVVRAMDTVQDFLNTLNDSFSAPAVGAFELPRIDDFIVLGGSKRGWATWLSAAVESLNGDRSRIKAILPASIDLLKMDHQFTHHWEAYGFYAPAIEDYVAFDLPCRAETPAGRAMLAIIDPYAYRQRYTMPKFVLNSAGDQFFLPDSSQFYFADLLYPKLLRYTLNTDHTQSQDVERLILAALSWLTDVRDGEQGPQFFWSLEPDGSIQVQTFTEPKRVRLWQATNPDVRDFRLARTGVDVNGATGSGRRPLYWSRGSPSAGLDSVHGGVDLPGAHRDSNPPGN